LLAVKVWYDPPVCQLLLLLPLLLPPFRCFLMVLLV
jgi:hypothetical protein